MNRFFFRKSSLKLLENIRESGFPFTYDYEKHRLLLPDANGNDGLIFRLPITFSAPNPDLTFPEKPVHYVMLLVQSGSSALGYFEDGKNLDHKVFRAYMVRKKRGTSQIKHLKTKGKSRAGSRVRLAETEEFFDNINERLQEYFAEHNIDRIAISCSKILVPYLFNTKVTTPFDQRDERLLKIPKHVHLPIYEVLLDTHKFLLKGELIWEESRQAFVSGLIASISGENTDSPDFETES